MNNQNPSTVYRVTLSDGSSKVGSAVRYAALRRQYPKKDEYPKYEKHIVKVEVASAEWEEWDENVQENA